MKIPNLTKEQWNQTVHTEMSLHAAIAIIGNIQLALRHKDNTGASALLARTFAKTLGHYLSKQYPELEPFIERGWNPDYDAEEITT